MGRKWFTLAAANNLKDRTQLDWKAIEYMNGDDALEVETEIDGECREEGEAKFQLLLGECGISFTPEIESSDNKTKLNTVDIKARFSHQLEIDKMARNEFDFPIITDECWDKAVSLLKEKTRLQCKKLTIDERQVVGMKCVTKSNGTYPEFLLRKKLRSILDIAVEPHFIILPKGEKNLFQITIHIIHPLEIAALAKKYDDEKQARATISLSAPIEQTQAHRISLNR